MKCPHCCGPVAPATPTCSCGFSASAISAFLGSEWVRLERITDNVGRLSLRDSRHLETVLDEFERTFPQVFLAVYLGPLPRELTLGGFGFWLINHGAFNTPSAARRNDFAIVLIIDPMRDSASLTLGYALEPLLPVPDLERILRQIRRKLARGEFAGAIEAASSALKRCLKQRATMTPHPAPTAPPATGDVSLLGLEPLRRPGAKCRSPARHGLFRRKESP